MRTKTLKELILTTLRRNRYSMTANQIIAAIEEEIETTEGSLSVMLCRFKSEGLLDSERTYCHCCGHRTCQYKLTDLGFIKARDYEPLSISIAQFADIDEVA